MRANSTAASQMACGTCCRLIRVLRQESIWHRTSSSFSLRPSVVGIDSSVATFRNGDYRCLAADVTHSCRRDTTFFPDFEAIIFSTGSSTTISEFDAKIEQYSRYFLRFSLL